MIPRNAGRIVAADRLLRREGRRHSLREMPCCASPRRRGVAILRYEEMIPAGRLARAEDHACIIAWLASDEAAHITGQVISVDGAQSIYHPHTREG